MLLNVWLKAVVEIRLENDLNKQKSCSQILHHANQIHFKL